MLLLVERYVSRREKSFQAKESADDRLENGRVPGVDGALKLLAKKYLVVYAIVMGEFSTYLSDRHRKRR
jgi:hypothetical protein